MLSRLKTLLKRKQIIVLLEQPPEVSIPYYIGNSVKLVKMCSWQREDKTYYSGSLMRNIDEQIILLSRKRKELTTIIEKIDKDIEALNELSW